ncbi:MAG TPA: YihY family inner membrane protein [Burkholderiales bacterium]|nr:YihY family inner membrane protein [Burkholderiales bacterium]HYA47405.1 YihY family inner membrane protein [Burkholderiales bacterium]
MSSKLRQLGRFLAYLLRRFDQDRCLQIASSLTFTTLLALVPLVTIMLTLTSAFPVFSGLGEHIHAFLLANMLPEKAGRIVSGYIEQFSGRAGRLTAVGTAFLAVTAFMLMFTIEHAFNSIWRVSRPRPVAQRILVYWAALTLGPVLIGASLSITSYLVGVSLGLARETPLAGTTILWLVPFLLTWAAFTLLYYGVPNRAVKPRHALAGGLVAALVFEIMKRSFALYIAHFPTYTFVYGAFAVIPIFLLWVYFSWVSIVIGALIAALAPDFAVLRGAAGPSAVGFRDALATLVVLARAQRGPGLLDLRTVAKAVSLTVDQAERLLERMAARGWVARSSGERYAMVFDKERLQVGDVYREFVLDSKGASERPHGDALEGVMAQLAARADETLSLPIARLLEGESA